jgi:acetyl-CoA carboxylase biotin carboxyl carrier protein
MNKLRFSISLNPIEASPVCEVNRPARTDPGNWANWRIGPGAARPISLPPVPSGREGTHLRAQEDGQLADVEAHITGTVWKIEVEVGDSIEEGDTVVILESMKMEMPVEAEDPGVVKQIVVEEGQSVSEGDTLVVLE